MGHIMIVSCNVINLSEQSPGRFRCTFNYVLDDGREVNIKPASVDSNYQAICESKADSVFDSVIKSDAKKAFSIGVKDAYGYATQAQVFYEYLEAGCNNPDPAESYKAMNGVAQQLLGMGLTTEQLAEMLGEPVETAQNVIDRWLLLESNKATIDAYDSLRSQM